MAVHAAGAARPGAGPGGGPGRGSRAPQRSDPRRRAGRHPRRRRHHAGAEPSAWAGERPARGPGRLARQRLRGRRPVRSAVHHDGEADRISRSLQATAFTAGSDVYLHLGHVRAVVVGRAAASWPELAHVVQQTDRARPGRRRPEDLSSGARTTRRRRGPTRWPTAPSRPCAVRPRWSATGTLDGGAACRRPGPLDVAAPVRRQAARGGRPRCGRPAKDFFSGVWDRLKGRKAPGLPAAAPVLPTAPGPACLLRAAPAAWAATTVSGAAPPPAPARQAGRRPRVAVTAGPPAVDVCCACCRR